MTESTENAIPNKKNNQKNVVIIPIHVHHHDSKVSQIFGPDIASDMSQAQQKNLEEDYSLPRKTQLSDWVSVRVSVGFNGADGIRKKKKTSP
ncbi:hypothetical protein TNCV_3253891 [Trichonephila clavipes]|nr:hypothetical protein TNCV_3253891 [Trichonephila clavipes]